MSFLCILLHWKCTSIGVCSCCYDSRRCARLLPAAVQNLVDFLSAGCWCSISPRIFRWWQTRRLSAAASSEAKLAGRLQRQGFSRGRSRGWTGFHPAHPKIRSKEFYPLIFFHIWSYLLLTEKYLLIIFLYIAINNWIEKVKTEKLHFLKIRLHIP